MMLLLKVIFVPASHFSVKRAESYQFAPSYLLPPPSTLLGAFARGLFLLKKLPAPENEAEAKAMIVTTTVRALAPLARTGALIKRLRTLEPLEKETEPIKPRTDAMVREIISLPKLEVYYLLNEDKVRNQLGEKAEIELRKIIHSIDRLGDSESLVTAASVNVIKLSAMAPSSEVIVNTILAKDLIDSIEGEYIYTTMPDMRNREKPKGYYIPLSIVKERTDVYCPSSFRVSPKKEILMVKIGETSLLFSGNRQ